MTKTQKDRFESEVLPHMDAAYSLARWLVRDEQVAEDIVQDACLRAFRYFDAFQGHSARPWLLGIVRNVCNTWFVQSKRDQDWLISDVDGPPDHPGLDARGQAQTPETLLIQTRERARVNAAIAELAVPYREVLVLREMEELSYEEIARIVQAPVGTVMSRLSRARARLRETLRTAR